MMDAVQSMSIDDSGREARAEDVPGTSRTPWRRLFGELAIGRMEALEELYDAASASLYGLALWLTRDREDAADVVSEAFVRLAEQGERLTRVRDPRAWLLVVTHRLAVDVVRRRRRRPSDPLDAAELVVAVADDPGRARDASRASALLAELPTTQREAVYLRHYADCTFAVIGRITGVPIFTAASRYRLGIRRLRRLLEVEP